MVQSLDLHEDRKKGGGIEIDNMFSVSWSWSYMTLVLAFGRLKQEDQLKCETSLYYVEFQVQFGLYSQRVSPKVFCDVRVFCKFINIIGCVVHSFMNISAKHFEIILSDS